MKIMFLALLMSFSAFAAPPTNPTSIASLNMAGRTITDFKNLIKLVGFCNGSALSTTFRKVDETSGYLPSGTKGFRPVLLTWYPTVITAAGDSITYSYGDADVGLNSASAITNPVYPGGSTNTGQITVGATSTVGNQYAVIPPPFKTINGKYTNATCNQANTAFRMTLYGYEE